MVSGIAKWVYRHISQEVCPWNVRFARSLADDSPFQPREVLAGRDARALARAILQMSQEEFSAAFRKSPMKRAKLRGLKRNAAVVLGNGGAGDDIALLERVRGSEADEMLREHAAWALARLSPHDGMFPRMSRRDVSITLRPLNARPDGGLSEAGSPESRLALVETLSREAWELAGRMTAPPVPRAKLPVSVRPLHTVSGRARNDPAGA